MEFKTSYILEDLYVLSFLKLPLMAASIGLATTYNLVPSGETMVWRKTKTTCPKSLTFLKV